MYAVTIKNKKPAEINSIRSSLQLIASFTIDTIENDDTDILVIYHFTPNHLRRRNNELTFCHIYKYCSVFYKKITPQTILVYSQFFDYHTLLINVSGVTKTI